MTRQNREDWLRAAAAELSPLFAPTGAVVPDRVRYTCGWPSRGARRSKRQSVGQCFAPETSADSTTEVILSMQLDEPAEVLAVLAHELVHAAVGCEHGHGPRFRRVALAIGLTGKMTSTVASEAFTRAAAPMLERLGPYPHASVDAGSVKKQGTRMIACVCPECGYKARTTRNWLESAGAPLCPTHKIPMRTPKDYQEAE